ncbi:17517_t:CDS:1, partial [Funneliformis geosporum]
NADKSNQYLANDMLLKLLHIADSEKLDSEIILKVEIIENWTSRYFVA